MTLAAKVLGPSDPSSEHNDKAPKQRPRHHASPGSEGSHERTEEATGAQVSDRWEGRHVSLATTSAGPQTRRVALAVMLLSSLAFAAAIPFVRVQLPKMPAFIPSYESALALNDFITTILLFSQFQRTRSLAFLALASGYLFDALIIIPHLLTFPGVFSETGLLGAGSQTAAWLWVFWHGGFPLFALAYALLAGRTFADLGDNLRGAVAVAVAIVLCSVCGLTLLATAGHDLLPVLIRDDDFSLLITKGVSPTVWCLTFLALVTLWRRNGGTVLDVWLLVVLSVWLFDVALSALIDSSRYDLGWYGGRIYGLLAASFVLAVLLLETNELHRRLAIAQVHLHDRTRQLERDVRERTAELGRSDVTLKAETAARKKGEESSSLLAAIVASSDDAILSKTVDGIITSWNGGAERLFGWRAAEAIGQHIRMIIPPDRWAEEARIIATIRANKKIEHYETVRLSKDGRLVPISVSISPLHDETGRVVGATNVARDISMRKRQEAEIARHVTALERSNKELDDFAYIASHDLKEPLRGLFNNAKFLHEDYAEKLDHEGVSRLQRLGYLCQRMEQLINDLLYFSRLGRQELAIQPTDLNAVIRDIETMSETTLNERNASIVIPKPLPVVSCDKVRIAEVFRNLITNAVKYNDSATKLIEVGCLDEARTKDGVEKQVFYVKDNGIGIAEEFYEDIFRIFKRLNAEDDDKKGTGVGLTFVRKIIERHGGRIWLDSVPGQGTTFYFTITRGSAYEAAA